MRFSYNFEFPNESYIFGVYILDEYSIKWKIVVEELCTIVHRTKASQIGKNLYVKLLDTIP